jgi:hypothetical protein
VLFDFCARFGGDGVVDHVVEEGDELGAGHLIAPRVAAQTASLNAKDLISRASVPGTQLLLTRHSCGSSG